MRWQFIDPKNRREVVERRAVTDRIDAWWREFGVKADEIAAVFSQRGSLDLPEWMEQHLAAIDPNLCWEFGPAVLDAGHRLVITPESAHHLRPLVRAILERAPMLEGWEFYEYRLAEDLEIARATVEGRSEFDISGLRFLALRNDQNRIDLKYSSATITDPEDSSALNAAFVTTESLLGEQCLNNWIGAIEITQMPGPRRRGSQLGGKSKESPNFLALDRLKETVDALIEKHTVNNFLRSRIAIGSRGTQWTMWESAGGGRRLCRAARSLCRQVGQSKPVDGGTQRGSILFQSDIAVVGRRSVTSSLTGLRDSVRMALPINRKSRMRWMRSSSPTRSVAASAVGRDRPIPILTLRLGSEKGDSSDEATTAGGKGPQTLLDHVL